MPFCTQCGGAISRDHRYCAHCGAALQPPVSSEPTPAHEAATGGAADTEPNVAPSADPPSRRAIDAWTPRAVQLSGSGSGLFADVEMVPPGSTERGVPAWAVMAGVLIALILSGMGGYWWFSAKRSSGRAVAVEATEQTLEQPDSRDRQPPTDHSARSAAGDATAHLTAAGEPRWTLIADSTRDTTDAGAALGPPDQKAAVIAPGGSLAVGYPADTYFYNGPGADIDVTGPDGQRADYRIFARAGPGDRWVRFDVNRRGFRNGLAAHDIGHHGMERAQQILITNDGEADLHIDAVTARYTQPVGHDEHESGSAAHKPAAETPPREQGRSH